MQFSSGILCTWIMNLRRATGGDGFRTFCDRVNYRARASCCVSQGASSGRKVICTQERPTKREAGSVPGPGTQVECDRGGLAGLIRHRLGFASSHAPDSYDLRGVDALVEAVWRRNEDCRERTYRHLGRRFGTSLCVALSGKTHFSLKSNTS